jgi:hypothetical protein
MWMISSLAYRRQPQAEVKHDDLDYGYAEKESTHWPSSDLTQCQTPSSQIDSTCAALKRKSDRLASSQ